MNYQQYEAHYIKRLEARIAELEAQLVAAGEFHLTDCDEQTAALRRERDAWKQRVADYDVQSVEDEKGYYRLRRERDEARTVAIHATDDDIILEWNEDHEKATCRLCGLEVCEVTMRNTIYQRTHIKPHAYSCDVNKVHKWDAPEED